jgi:hypothetical protein
MPINIDWRALTPTVSDCPSDPSASTIKSFRKGGGKPFPGLSGHPYVFYVHRAKMKTEQKVYPETERSQVFTPTKSIERPKSETRPK